MMVAQQSVVVAAEGWQAVKFRGGNKEQRELANTVPANVVSAAAFTK
jgi:hypothetical protein